MFLQEGELQSQMTHQSYVVTVSYPYSLPNSHWPFLVRVPFSRHSHFHFIPSSRWLSHHFLSLFPLSDSAFTTHPLFNITFSIHAPFPLPKVQSWSHTWCEGLHIHEQPGSVYSPPCDRLIGLVVMASASRVEDPRFESRLRQDFSGVESYQWLENWHASGYPARRLVL